MSIGEDVYISTYSRILATGMNIQDRSDRQTKSIVDKPKGQQTNQKVQQTKPKGMVDKPKGIVDKITKGKNIF